MYYSTHSSLQHNVNSNVYMYYSAHSSLKQKCIQGKRNNELRAVKTWFRRLRVSGSVRNEIRQTQSLILEKWTPLYNKKTQRWAENQQQWNSKWYELPVSKPPHSSHWKLSSWTAHRYWCSTAHSCTLYQSKNVTRDNQ